MQLSRGEVMVGHRVNKFLKEAGLTYKSVELDEFYEGVTKFYHEVSEKLTKYFRTPLTSR